MGDFLTSSGGLGLIGSVGSGIGGLLGSESKGIAASSEYDSLSSSALIESSALSSKYKVGAINMMMNAQAEQAEYESSAYSYEIEALRKKGQASEYDIESAISLLNKANSLRTAAIYGASALDAVRSGAEQEAKLREQGRLFRGNQQASIGAGGTDVGSGNALDILRQTDEGIESDSASIRYGAQKNRYQLLVQQKNLYMQAEAQQLESENYQTAAENMRASAEVSLMGASTMRKMGDLAYKSGEEGSVLYGKLSDIALQNGQAASQTYKNLSGIAKSSAKASGISGLLSSVGEGITGIAVQSSGSSGKSSGSAGFSYNALGEDGWGDIAFSAGDSDWWKKNEYKLGNFVPTVKSYKGGGF